MRNVTCAIVAAMVVLLGSALPAQAWGGHSGHHGYGGHHGFGGYYRYPTYGYRYPSRSYAPTAYVQQQFYWYYCEDANAYYPYVQQCSRGWKKVVPSPSRPAQ